MDKWELLRSYIKGAIVATDNDSTEGFLTVTLSYMSELEDKEAKEREELDRKFPRTTTGPL